VPAKQSSTETVDVEPAVNGKAVKAVKLTKPAAPAKVAEKKSRSMLLPALLALVAVLFGGVAVWCGVQTAQLRTNASATNTALTDAAATAEVKRQITSAVNTVFSYDYSHVSTTEQAAGRLLTGPAIQQYTTLIAMVKQQAPAQKLVLTTSVVTAGVVMLQGNRARLLVFADQRNVRSDTGQASYAGTHFAVDAVRVNGSWKIANLDFFTG
jgi:Mce-associated membrane protein